MKLRDRDGDHWVPSTRAKGCLQRVLPDGTLDTRIPDRESVEVMYGPLVDVSIADRLDAIESALDEIHPGWRSQGHFGCSCVGCS